MGGDQWITSLHLEGRPEPPPAERLFGEYKSASPGYFAAMGIRLLKGRVFTDRDIRDAPRVVLVSETLARRYYPDEDPIGKRFAFGTSIDDDKDDVQWEIVGVVDGRSADKGEIGFGPPPKLSDIFVAERDQAFGVVEILVAPGRAVGAVAGVGAGGMREPRRQSDRPDRRLSKAAGKCEGRAVHLVGVGAKLRRIDRTLQRCGPRVHGQAGA
jgi:hypothetical protein